MKLHRYLALLTFGTALGLFSPILPAQTAPAAAPASQPSDDEPADIPVIKIGKAHDRFLKMHESFVERAKQGNIDLLFLGDSITERWGNAKDIWEKYYGQHKPANFGISGDRIQHVLWRIENGELDGIHPKALVLMIGTNNVRTNNSAPEILSANQKLVAEIRQRLPDTKILLLGIFMRGANPAEYQTAAYRKKIVEINAGLAALDDGKMIHYLDINSNFVASDGTISKDVMADYLHLTVKGYQIWADAMAATLEKLFKP